MDKSGILEKLKSMESPENRAGMARYGINIEKAFGVSVKALRQIARETGKDHSLAGQLWDTGYHEARILAGLIDRPEEVTESQMEEWVKDFNSWDLCDLVCSHLFDKTPFAHKKAVEWSSRDEEFVKRAGFTLMAALSVHDKKAPDKDFLAFLPIIEREASDERNYVKKAVNCALRQIGKRNTYLNKKAIETAKEIQNMDSRPARWIASDALRELKSEAVQRRLAKKY